MAPVAAPERVRRAPAAPHRTPGTAPTPARPVEAPGRPGPRRPLHRTTAVCAALVVGSLLMVVGANAYLTQGQVRLTRMQEQLTSAAGTHRNLELHVARLSNPSAVVSQAEGNGLTAPTHVTDIPQVTLPDPSATTTSTTGGHPSAGSTSRQ